mgnify:FL=1
MSSAYVVTYASGKSKPFSRIEVRDLDGTVLAICGADSMGQWNVALPGAVHWIQIWSKDSSPEARMKKPSISLFKGNEPVPELTITCFNFDEMFTVDGLAGRGIGGHTSAEPGQRITATIGIWKFETTPGEDGTWVIPFSSEMEKELGNGVHLVCVAVNDKRGNEAIVWDQVAVG